MIKIYKQKLREGILLNSIVKQYEKNGVIIDIFETINSAYKENRKIIELSRIIVPKEKREQGLGTKFMQNLIDYADKENKIITLSASIDFGGAKGRLIEFYKRFGFIENKGRNKDFSISDTMYRLPKGALV